MKTHIRFTLFAVLAVTGLLLAACGALPAGADVNFSQDGKNAAFEFNGVVNSMGPAQWVVAGQTLLVNASTVIDPGIAEGDTVQVKGMMDSGGAATASRIERRGADSAATEDSSSKSESDSHLPSGSLGLELTGKVDSIAADSWTVAGLVFAISSRTEIKGTIAVGDLVKVEAEVNADGTFSAIEIKLDVNSVADSSGSLLELSGKVDSIAADLWTVSGMKFAITAATEIKGEFKVGDPVKVEALVNPDGTFTARQIGSSLDDTANSDDSANPGNGVAMEFTGVVTAISPTSWTIGGKVFSITKDTEIKGTIVVGDTVKVETFGSINGALSAREIRKLDANSGGTPVPGSTDDHGGSSSNDDPASTAQPTDDHGGGSGRP